MAAANGKKGFRLRFELSLSGLLGVVVVCFCIFLWMFLLGLWAGQTGLISGKSFSSLPAIPAAAKIGAAGNKVMEAPEVQPEEPESYPAPAEPAANPEPTPETPASAVTPEPAAAPGEESAYYALQIGAFRDSRYVEEALRKWRAKGYEPFALPPVGADAHLVKVYLGRFSEVVTARKEAERLAKQEGIAPVISLIPAGPAKRP